MGRRGDRPPPHPVVNVIASAWDCPATLYPPRCAEASPHPLPRRWSTFTPNREMWFGLGELMDVALTPSQMRCIAELSGPFHDDEVARVW